MCLSATAWSQGKNTQLKNHTNNINTDKMKVEIWSDVMCPFCYIGKRNHESALAQFADRNHIELVWGQSVAEVLARRGVSALVFRADFFAAVFFEGVFFAAVAMSVSR